MIFMVPEVSSDGNFAGQKITVSGKERFEVLLRFFVVNNIAPR